MVPLSSVQSSYLQCSPHLLILNFLSLLISLKLVAADSGVPPLVTERNFTVEVLDVNDSPPVFVGATLEGDDGGGSTGSGVKNKVYETTLEEGVAPEAVVLRVEAKDADEGINARVSYRFVDEDPWFDINSETGLITTKAQIDCDTNPHPEVKVLDICTIGFGFFFVQVVSVSLFSS